jgi:hypothetical protein
LTHSKKFFRITFALILLKTGKKMIDIDTIELIHANQNGYIGFARKLNNPKIGKDEKKRYFENLFSIRISDLKSTLPGLVSWLFADSYFTINSYYQPAKWLNSTTNLPDVNRKENNLTSLNCCYCDLDVGRPKSKNPFQRLTFAKATYHIQSLTEEGHIPAPSFIVNSGRGAYLLWLLVDKKDNLTIRPKSWPENVILYKNLNKALGEKLESLAWDKRAFDAARILRVPGSYHIGAGNRVGYQVQYGEDGKMFFYTLEDLAGFMGLNIPEKSKIITNRIIYELKDSKFRATKDKGSRPQNRKGFVTLNLKRIQDLLTLEQHAGGFPHGCRRRRLTVYAEFCRKAGFSFEETKKALEIMAKNCKPAYPSESNDPHIETILKTVFSNKKGAVRNWTNEKLCQELKITAELARELNLTTIVPPEITAERKAKPSPCKLEKMRRQAAIKEILRLDFYASCREISRILNENEIKGSHMTVSRELPGLRTEIQKERLTLLKAS